MTFVDRAGRTVADAPKAQVTERDKSVVMTGGVRARTSQGNLMTCDVLTYIGASEKLRGEGHVRLELAQRLRAGRRPPRRRRAAAERQDHLGAGPVTERDRIVMSDLVKKCGRREFVEGVSAEVRRGEVVGLGGPNGAGKTTTFYMVVGLVRPDVGSVVLSATGGARDDPGPDARAGPRGLGYLAQEARSSAGSRGATICAWTGR